MLDKIQQQIEQAVSEQIKEEQDLIAQATAKLEQAKLEKERSRIAAEEVYRKAEEAHRQKEREAIALAKSIEKQETERRILEEQKLNSSLSKKQHDEKLAAELKQKISELQFMHEQALKAAQDSLAVAETLRKSKDNLQTEEQLVLDGSSPKEVVNNTDGNKNPLRRFVQSNNT
jgi:hypothetical protein